MVQRKRIKIKGIVQGVGFRPFVYRLANDLEMPLRNLL
jgi:hydrogenase maturation factor HypF (carbamoyltransferase family)